MSRTFSVLTLDLNLDSEVFSTTIRERHGKDIMNKLYKSDYLKGWTFSSEYIFYTMTYLIKETEVTQTYPCCVGKQTLQYSH